jgi:hypothetical protein
MSMHDTVLEQELRELFAEIPAPPAPATWRRDPSWSDRRPRARRPLVLALVALVVIGGGVAVYVQARREQNVVTVSALPAASDLTCSLPIAALSDDHTTGFVVFQHGQATFRAASGGPTYVAALGRWADVLPQDVAPDGRSYVDETRTYGSHAQVIISVVDAAGSRTLLKADPTLSVFGFARQGILIDSFGQTPDDRTLHLELLDPVTGQVRPFPFPPPTMGASADFRPEDDAIWLVGYPTAPGAAVVTRYDLATGVTTEWFDGRTDGGGSIEVVATDGRGHPIVQLSNHDLFHTNPAQRAGIGQRTLLLTAPHQETVLNQGRVGDPGVANNLDPLSVNDGDRIWLAADDGTIWMYLPGSGLLEMAKVIRTSTSGPPGVVVSGPCR